MHMTHDDLLVESVITLTMLLLHVSCNSRKTLYSYLTVTMLINRWQHLFHSCNDVGPVVYKHIYSSR